MTVPPDLNTPDAESIAERAIRTLARSGLTLQGRTFRPAQKEITADQHMWTWTRLTKSGIAKVARGFNIRDKDGLGDFSETVLCEAYDSGQMWELMAGILMEEGVPWSRAAALANAEFFKSLTDPAEHTAMNGAMVGVLLSFLLKNVAAELISQRSTSGRDIPAPTVSPRPSPEPPPTNTVVPRRGTTGRSARSSKKSRATTTRGGKS